MNQNGFESNEQEQYFLEIERQKQEERQQQDRLNEMCDILGQLVNDFGFDTVNSFLQTLKE